MADPLDIFGAWREALSRWERETNAVLSQATSNEDYTRAMNQSFSLMARLQARQAEATEKALNAANLPSKGDFRTLDARLDDIQAQITTLTDMVKRLLPETAPGVVAGPPRTRKPPAGAKLPSSPETSASKTSATATTREASS